MSTTFGDHAKLKHLNTLRDKARSELASAKDEQRESSRRVNELNDRYQDIERQIVELQDTSPTVIVSEHAIVRYFERVLGYDIEEIKKKIVPEKVASQIKHFGGGNFPVDGTEENPAFRIRVRSNTVVTITTTDSDYS